MMAKTASHPSILELATVVGAQHRAMKTLLVAVAVALCALPVLAGDPPTNDKAYKDYLGRRMRKTTPDGQVSTRHFTRDEWDAYCPAHRTDSGTCRGWRPLPVVATADKPANWNLMSAQEQERWWLCRDDPTGKTAQCRTVEKPQPQPVKVQKPAKTKTVDIKVNFLTDIEGAKLYQDDVFMGTTPTQLKYRLAEGCPNVKPVVVRWASGAEASVEGLRVCTNTGKVQQFTFNRPIGYPGREFDAQFALQLAMLAEQRAEARARAWAELQQQIASLFPKPAPLPPTVHCTSTVLGPFINTDCR